MIKSGSLRILQTIQIQVASNVLKERILLGCIFIAGP